MVCQAVNKAKPLPLLANPVVREMARGERCMKSGSGQSWEGPGEWRVSRCESEAKSEW